MRHLSLLIAAATLLLQAPMALARLGDKTTVPAKVPSALQSKAMVSANYGVRDSVINNVQIKEYISDAGIVFAVSWRGVAEPDLNDLLGDYYSDYDQAANRQLPTQRTGKSAVISSNQIVVRKFGHMRDVRGIAYVPTLVPATFDLGELQ